MTNYSALVTADLHLNDNTRDEYRHVFMREQLPKFIKQYHPRYLIILGDLTDEKDRHRSELVNAVVEYLCTCADMVDRLIILRGNHDCLDPTSPFFGFVNRLPKIDWFSNPFLRQYEELGGCLFLPHTRNYEKDWNQFDFAPYKRDPNWGWIFCHNSFEGAISETGRRLNGIPTSVFPENAKVLSGDIHVPQKVGPVTYVGAPYTMRFGDAYKPRVRLLCKNGRKLRMDSQLCFGTEKRLVEIKELNKLDQHVEEFAEGDLVKLRVHLKAEEYSKWQEIKLNLRDWVDQHGGILCEIQPVKQVRSIKLNKKTISTRSDTELLQSYGKRKGVAANVLKTGLWLMKQI